MGKSKAAKFFALDLGAESGRAIVGGFDGELLRLEEIHRFSNGPVQVLDSLHWDVLYLWKEIKRGLALAAEACGDSLTSIGLDTWGVDFGLLAADDTLLGNPYNYRDGRTNGMMEVAFQRVSRAEIYERTGIQFMQMNSLYQLLAMAQSEAPALALAKTFLTMPDLFNFWLTGRKVNEFTIATTTQCYDPRAGDWARDLLEQLGISGDIFQNIIPSGIVVDSLLASVAQETGCAQISVVAPGTHDTASAVAAVPATDSDYIYLSSGTWSLMGVEIDKPLITPESLNYDFTNEGGVNDTFRLLKNIMGLWLVQECRHEWARTDKTYSYDELSQIAAASPAFGSLVVPGDPRFLAPGDMPGRIQAFCGETGQSVPETHGAIVRCALESLALEYRWVAERLQDMLGRPLSTVHIIGGGSRNSLLNQFTADATGRRVVAGPAEATAIGNVVVQALTMGYIPSLAEGRAIVRRSFEVTVFEPGETAAWDVAYERYLKLRAEIL